MHHLGVSGQGRGADPGGLVAHPLQHVLRRVDHSAGRRIGHRLQHDQIAEAVQQVGGEAPRIVAGIDHRLDGAEQRRGVPRGKRVDRIVDQRHVRRAEQRQRPPVLHLVSVGTGQQLIQHRQRVAWRAATGPDHQRIHRVVNGDVLLCANTFQQRSHGPRRQQPERVMVRARPDGGQHLLGLCRREHEDQVLGRFLDDLEQRIETGRGDHVRFVDDEDAVARLRWRVERAIAQLAGVVDAAVAGRVELR